MVALRACLQCTAQARHRIDLRAACRYRIAKDLAGELRAASRHFECTALLDLAQRIEHLRRFDLGDGILPQDGEDIAFKTMQDVLGRALLPAALFVRMP